MTNFSFVLDQTVRMMVERDKHELDKCLEHELNKSVLILSGSILEAVLVDYFLNNPKGRNDKEILKADLFQLVKWAHEENLISQKNVDLSTVIRGWRNLVHPGKEMRLKESFDHRTAIVAKNLVEMIVDEINVNYIEVRGLLAEQALSKIITDPASISITEKIVDTLSEVEKVRLIQMIVPRWIEGDVPYARANLEKLMKVIIEEVPQNVIVNELQKMYESVHSGSQKVALAYIRFYAQQLNKLSPEQFDVVIRYIYGLLQDAGEETLSSMFDAAVVCFVNSTDQKYDMIKLKFICGIIDGNDNDAELSKTRSNYLTFMHINNAYETDKFIADHLRYYEQTPILRMWAKIFGNRHAEIVENFGENL